MEPSNAELAKKLNLKTEAKKTYYDLIIIGGGPAGLTASIYASREGADTLLIERSGLGPGNHCGAGYFRFLDGSVWRNS
ncbi:MAG: FAD-dependent oxidoreductase [Anaerolineales bacterium]|nr:FAD-dependent oxidoreductase [Anaerolineales bacterium]